MRTPLIFHAPAAGVAFFASAAAWLAIETAIGARTGAQDRQSAREWTLSLIVVAMLASIAIGAVLAHERAAPLPGSAWWPVAAGLALMWAGVGLRLWSISTLGRFFKMVVAIQEEHRLVDRGPYRWLRHPSYSGGMMVVLGLGLAEADWLSLAVTLVLPLAAYLIRIRVEERALLNELGDDYAAYVRRTARLVPGLF